MTISPQGLCGTPSTPPTASCLPHEASSFTVLAPDPQIQGVLVGQCRRKIRSWGVSGQQCARNSVTQSSLVPPGARQGAFQVMAWKGKPWKDRSGQNEAKSAKEKPRKIRGGVGLLSSFCPWAWGYFNETPGGLQPLQGRSQELGRALALETKTPCTWRTHMQPQVNILNEGSKETACCPAFPLPASLLVHAVHLYPPLTPKSCLWSPDSGTLHGSDRYSSFGHGEWYSGKAAENQGAHAERKLLAPHTRILKFHPYGLH